MIKKIVRAHILKIKLVSLLVLGSIIGFLPIVTTVQALSYPQPGAWTQNSPNLPNKMFSSGTLNYDNYLYNFGGSYSGTVSSLVYSAPFNSNGSVGAFTQLSNSLPQPLYLMGVLQYDGYVYIFGGEDSSSSPVATVYSAPLLSSGGLGSWTTLVNNLPIANAGFSITQNNSYVYLIGGVSSAVYSAPLQNGGNLGTWTTDSNSLPTRLQGASSVTDNGYVYILGGTNSSANIVNLVYSAPLLSNGTVGPWTAQTNTLPVTDSSASAVFYNGYIYLLGGEISSAPAITNNVYSAPIVNNQVGSWITDTSVLPVSIFGDSSVLNNNQIYVIGGITINPGFNFLNTINYAALPLAVNAPTGNSTSTPGTTTVQNNSNSAPNTGYGQPSSMTAGSIITAVLGSSAFITIGLTIYRYSKKRFYSAR